MRKRRESSEVPARAFPPELLAEARLKPGGWVYAIDPAYAPEGPDGAVPPEGIIGAWKIADDGTPTGEYQANPRYGSSPSAQ
ncbi:MAG TPA: hypothetical protein DHU96_01735 [Actinobacteria bacterium]|nr:hypothetical protein [Actinomycetota bacterium]